MGPLHACEVTRLEVPAGMRGPEEWATRGLLNSLIWRPLDAELAERAGALGRRWLSSHGGSDSADLAVAATALHLGLPLLTTNVRHFPMFVGLQAPY
jgi:predicted nucleic acid-binding protein